MDFVGDNPGEPVPEETFTHSHLSVSNIWKIQKMHFVDNLIMDIS